MSSEAPGPSQSPSDSTAASAGSYDLRLNWRYEFRDKGTQEAFEDFNSKRQALSWFVVVIVSLSAGVILPLTISQLIALAIEKNTENSHDRDTDNTLISMQSMLFVLLVATLCLSINGCLVLWFQSTVLREQVSSLLHSFLVFVGVASRLHRSLSSSVSNTHATPASASVRENDRSVANPNGKRRKQSFSTHRPIAGANALHNNNNNQNQHMGSPHDLAIATAIKRNQVAPVAGDYHATMTAVDSNAPSTTLWPQPEVLRKYLRISSVFCFPLFLTVTYLSWMSISIVNRDCNDDHKTMFHSNHLHGGFFSPLPVCDSLSTVLVLHGLVVLIVLPMSSFAVIANVGLVSIVVSMALSLACLLIVWFILVTDTSFSWIMATVLIGCVSYGLLVIVEIQKKKIAAFHLAMQYRIQIEEHQRNAEQQRLKEMRHIIANFAHDLKTPLTSFISGIELIELSLSDTQQQRQQDEQIQSSSAYTLLDTCIESVQSSLSAIRSTHVFMMMTINRCLDYAKASKGMILIPKVETLDLMETLQVPLRCIHTMQQRIEIHLLGLPLDVRCQKLATDRQWLVENVLCLLSNAVKYSVDDCVHLTISIEELYNNDGAGLESVLASAATSIHPSQSPSPQKHPHQSSESEPSVRRKQRQASKMGSFFFQMTETSGWYPSLMPFVRIEVEDTGIGMSDEVMVSMFNPFKQSDRIAGGAGLGLYTLAKRMEALKGYCGVMKRRDGKQGSVFWFSFPLIEPPADPLKPQSAVFALPPPRGGDASGKDPARNVLTKNTSHLQIITTDRAVEAVELATGRPLTQCPSPCAAIVASRSTPLITPPSADVDGQHLHPVPCEDLRVPEKTTPWMTSQVSDKEVTPVVIHAQRVSSAATPMATTSTSAVTTAAKPAAEGLSILIVDDSPAILKMSSMLLRRLGHTVLTAENGQVAINLLQERRDQEKTAFGLILMDLQMPVMDGLEAMRTIRLWESEGEVFWKHRQAVIAMSANSDSDTSALALQAGADIFIPKPFTAQSIQVAIDQLLHSQPTS